MIIRRSINKEEVKDMPKAVFPGQIHVVQTPQEAERAVAYLKKCSILGIDEDGTLHGFRLFQKLAELGSYGYEFHDIAVEYHLTFFFHIFLI